MLALITTGAILQALTAVLALSSGGQMHLLSTHEMSLDKRYAIPSVNNVFKDNILLTLHYLSGDVKNSKEVNWQKIESPFSYKFELEPGKSFAFHDNVQTRYIGNVDTTTNAHFDASEGFKSDGYLYGDGVCHLASLINWAALDAGLDSYAPANHDFAVIPEIPRKYGVAIYSLDNNKSAGENQNLYVTNNQPNTIIIEFDYKNDELTTSIYEKQDLLATNEPSSSF